MLCRGFSSVRGTILSCPAHTNRLFPLFLGLLLFFFFSKAIFSLRSPVRMCFPQFPPLPFPSLPWPARLRFIEATATFFLARAWNAFPLFRGEPHLLCPASNSRAPPPADPRVTFLAATRYDRPSSNRCPFDRPAPLLHGRFLLFFHNYLFLRRSDLEGLWQCFRTPYSALGPRVSTRGASVPGTNGSPGVPSGIVSTVFRLG